MTKGSIDFGHWSLGFDWSLALGIWGYPMDLIWLNGDILLISEARLGVEDRGFQFADGVYEVIRLYGGRPFTLREHLERLERSAGGISLTVPLDRPRLTSEIERFLARANPGEGMIYLQLTR